MDMHQVSRKILAFVHVQGRSSCGMIHTGDGIVLVDTTARHVDILACLRLANATPKEVCLILITHSHSDHTSGIPIFDCPILAHKLTRQRIKKRGTDRSRAQIPTDVFVGKRDLDIGGMRIEVIHVGGHTPGSSVIWLPQERILFAGDLIFEGRYPFLATANVERLMEALRWLPSLEARIIVPGHGILCGDDEVLRQLKYIEMTWERTWEHIEKGHTLEESINDPSYPAMQN